MMATHTLYQQLLETLAPASRQVLGAVVAAATELDLPLYLVGGPVRDLLLGAVATDFDLAVEGDAIGLARHLQHRFGGEVMTHGRFGTAKWVLTTAVIGSASNHSAEIDFAGIDFAEIDFAMTRTETYAEPAALPDVALATIRDDLRRRDFSINALALRLDGEGAGHLLDFFGGLQDLERGIVRVLHERSFVDDPTRIWRAVRFEQRLGFCFDAQTAVWLQSGLPYIRQVSGHRLWYEFELIFQDGAVAQVLARLDELGVLAQIHPQLSWTPETAVLFAKLPSLLAQPLWQSLATAETLIFAQAGLWLATLPLAVQTAVLRRLRLPKRDQEEITAVQAAETSLAQLPETALPSQIVQRLRPYALRTLLLVYARQDGDGWLASQVRQYVVVWRGVKTAVTGHDLRALGIPPGQHYRQILDTLLAERLNGRLQNEADERNRLLELAAPYLQKVDSDPTSSAVDQFPSTK